MDGRSRLLLALLNLRVTTVQVRSGEVVEIDDITQNFRARQREQISSQPSDIVSSAVMSVVSSPEQSQAVAVENLSSSPSAIAGI
ncbi:hypothetical protein [cf. Phormidesmis sp. LEGE 11477]|uniref:hypothetical protein n=1 Tax=cf. Phormidesmis sp. LEGE 11477 TaxID=1828680 RepID=UPI00187E8F5D|nr:hypothetical protein [cf. Phormidesmis sp. LEGE 11477]MBE9064353.1 hypothetical protein [cf. Phormidesmis sp. LEGE 11477]